jgi:hypothetical protein
MLVESTHHRQRFSKSVEATFYRNQKLSLEGDFDKYFTLYAPKAYETDALYIFTPDLMALLIDQVAKFDVEIVDNWMLVYSRRPWNLTDRATQQRIAQIIRVVGRKTVNQTAMYSDDTVGNPAFDIVAPGGRRLRQRASITAGIAIALYLLIRLFSSLHGL